MGVREARLPSQVAVGAVFSAEHGVSSFEPGAVVGGVVVGDQWSGQRDGVFDELAGAAAAYLGSGRVIESDLQVARYTAAPGNPSTTR
jgi:hypothetical protein